jgi:type VI protein secretion system component Hcp
MRQFVELVRCLNRMTGGAKGLGPLMGIALVFCAIPVRAQVSITVSGEGLCSFPGLEWSDNLNSKSGALTLVKQFDACSTNLLQLVSNGRHLAEMQLTETDADPAGQEFILKMENVVGTLYAIYGSSSQAAPTEKLGFIFGEWNTSGVQPAPTSGQVPFSPGGQSTTSVDAGGLDCPSSSFSALNWEETYQVVGTPPRARLEMSDFSILKPVDSCSSALSNAQKTGTIFKTVTLTTQVTGTNTPPLLKITLKDVKVLIDMASGSTEQLKLSFAQLTLERTAP